MDVKIKELIVFTKIRFGLANYYLERHHINRNVNIFNDTIYTLSMEWFPNDVSVLEDDLNPDGTAVIEIDVNCPRIQSVIFVGGKSFASGVTFSYFDKYDIIRWIEQETGLIYAQQFQLEKEESGVFYFKACFDGIMVYPPGLIEVKLGTGGKLIFFAVHGTFPSKEIIAEETYTLSFAKVEQLAKEQLKLIEIPSIEQERSTPTYAMEEIFITNEQMKTMSFEGLANAKPPLQIDKTIYWDTPINKPFEREEIQLIEGITAEEAFSGEPSPETFPITEAEQEECIIAVKDLLQREYANDAGKWMLKTLNRDNWYIHATLRVNESDERILRRKLTIIIDAKSLQSVNYVDNKPMLEIYDSFQTPEKAMVAKKAAYEKLRDFVGLEPYYVYNFEQKQYVLCGALNCHYGVNASSGEVVALDEF